MSYWINIHHPREKGDSRKSQFRIYVQETGQSVRDKIKKGDLAFIYETGTPSKSQIAAMIDAGTPSIWAKPGKKGIIALVKIGDFRPGKWEWNGKSFVGSYDTTKLDTQKDFVSLSAINAERSKLPELGDFNPRMPAGLGGLRELSEKEFEVMSRLIGFDAADGGRGWSMQEVRDTVADYMSMLKCQLRDEEFIKTEHNKMLREKLHGRSVSAVEYKHQNISAILTELGYPYVIGYQPNYANYQKLLKEMVTEYVLSDKELEQTMTKAARRTPAEQPEVGLLSDLQVAPPLRRPNRQPRRRSGQPKGRPSTDYGAKERANRALGKKGEEWVLGLERRRLREVGRTDLAKKVEWVSQKRGDSEGYDILSFNEGGDPLHIEVKTTNQGKHFPFVITSNEVAVSRELSASYRLYRVFLFSSKPRYFVLSGAIDKRCWLDALSFQASF